MKFKVLSLLLTVTEITLGVLVLVFNFTVVSIPLFIIGLMSNSFEIWRMKKLNDISLWQLGRCIGLVAIEFLIFLNYFCHFWN